MRTRLGQNFLVDKNIAKKIIKSADVSVSDTVIEIGPGKGILTEELLQKTKKIIAVEIDKKLSEELIEKYKNQKNIKIINTDFLKYNPPKKLKLKFVANLPYYISSAIIEKILHLNNWDTAVFMLQKEVACRLKATSGFDDYGVLSIACQIFCSVEKMFNVPGTCFNPKPEVTSTVVKLKRLKNPLIKTQIKPFKSGTNQLETHKKTITKGKRSMLAAKVSAYSFLTVTEDKYLSPIFAMPQNNGANKPNMTHVENMQTL